MVTAFCLIVLGIAGVFFLAVVLPFRVDARIAGDTDAGFRGSARVMHCAGLFGWGVLYDGGKTQLTILMGRRVVFSMDAARFTRKSGGRRPQKTEKTPEAAAKAVTLSERISRLAGKAREFRYYAGAAARIVPGILSVDWMRAGLRFGLGDPALTGYLAGLVYAVNGVLPKRFILVPEWEFTRRAFACDIDAALTFRTHRFLFRVIREAVRYAAVRRKWRAAAIAAPDPREVRA